MDSRAEHRRMSLQLDRPPTLPPDTVAAGLRAFFRIAQQWNLSNDEAIVLLGQPARSTFFKWKKGEIGKPALSFDLATRLGHLLGIFKALETLYASPELADRWIREPNAALAGQSALSRMMAGQITDLAAVRGYLESVRGGP